MPNSDLDPILVSLKRYVELEEMSGVSEVFLSEGKNNSVSGWDILRQEVTNCTKCGLYKSRNNVVFGSGDRMSRLMFIGEAPGMEEDLQGMPFVGRAGKLLEKIIQAMGLKREDVYIGNVLKCRPPNNRNPLPAEILTCEEYLIRQIEHIKPKVICALGKFAAQTLLRETTPISKLRGKFYDYHGTKLMPTFHPAYLLRNPKDKRMVWEDMKKIMKVIG